jgi:hypothetical protein
MSKWKRALLGIATLGLLGGGTASGISKSDTTPNAAFQKDLARAATATVRQQAPTAQAPQVRFVKRDVQPVRRAVEDDTTAKRVAAETQALDSLSQSTRSIQGRVGALVSIFANDTVSLKDYDRLRGLAEEIELAIPRVHVAHASGMHPSTIHAWLGALPYQTIQEIILKYKSTAAMKKKLPKGLQSLADNLTEEAARLENSFGKLTDAVTRRSGL